MITRKELDYINVYPNRTPYPGVDYCRESLEKLKKCYELYKNNYQKRQYTIQFSNSEEVDMSIQDKNVAHLLGIEYSNLKGAMFDSFREEVLGYGLYDTFSSFMLLERILEQSEEILKRDERAGSCFAINYYRVGIKCDIFSKLADLSNFHYACINFDKTIYSTLYPDLNFTPKSTKLLYTYSDEMISPYFMMGIKKEESSNSTTSDSSNVFDGFEDNNSKREGYIVETLMAVDDPVRFFNGQEVVIPTQILTDDNGKFIKNLATNTEKIALIREYQNIVNQYDIADRINILGDYISKLISDKNQELQLKK